MANPFSTFTVQPTYGTFGAVIDFQLQAGKSGDVYIYRSMNGETGWELLNPEAPITVADGGSASFGDTTLEGTFNLRPYYRGLLDPAGGDETTWESGPQVAPFAWATRKQKVQATMILKREYRRMSGRKSSGMTAFHLIPLEDGTAVSRYDSETGQLLGPSCPDEPLDDGFGTKYVGGYHSPLQTKIRVLAAAPIESRSEDGTRQTRTADLKLRLLAHPRPQVGHVIVIPQSDRRYVIESGITPFYFPGTDIPVAWEVRVSLLDSKDPRHRITIPAPASDIVSTGGTQVQAGTVSPIIGGDISGPTDPQAAESNFYKEYTVDVDGNPTLIETYTDATKTTHLFTKTLTWVNGLVTQTVETNIQTGAVLTTTYTYDVNEDIETVTQVLS